ncbi:MAG: hypothetical protein HC804_11235 [Anaerolineae bacterium]|nr:hypothetical protein [Anaerolineae bacterium]
MDAIGHAERIGYVYEVGELLPVTTAAEEHGRTQTVAISLAGEEIGTIVLEEMQADLSPNDLEVVNAVARQVSQQIENLRLLEEAERYRQEAEEASRRLVREGWDDLPQREQHTGFTYDQTAVQPLTSSATDAPAMVDIALPLAVQGEEIGRLELVGVTADDTQTTVLLTAVAARLSAPFGKSAVVSANRRSVVSSQRAYRRIKHP